MDFNDCESTEGKHVCEAHKSQHLKYVEQHLDKPVNLETSIVDPKIARGPFAGRNISPAAKHAGEIFL